MGTPKKTLHVLYLNHIFRITVNARHQDKEAREGAADLAKLIIDKLHNQQA